MGGDGGQERVGWGALGLGEGVFETLGAEIKGCAHDLETVIYATVGDTTR